VPSKSRLTSADLIPPGYLLLDDGRIMGGAELFLLRVARHLAHTRPDARLRIACLPGTGLAAECDRQGLTWLPARFPEPAVRHTLALTGAVVHMRRLLGDLDPGEVVIGNSARAQAVGTIAAITRHSRPPLVHVIHEQDSAARPSARWLYRRFGVVIAIGANVATAYERALRGVTVQRANNFLLPDEVDHLTTLRRPARVRPPVLGVLGRLIPDKGILELVEDLAHVPGSWSELRVSGERQDPAYAARVEDRAIQLGLGDRVRVVGEFVDSAAFLAELDVLVVSSVGNEGQPTIVLEGLAAGLPVVMRESVYSDDYVGFPVRPYASVAELAAALTAPPTEPVPTGEFLRRFGPEQFILDLDAAAARAAT
jgi:glycosyltransferase involved in cell wall biosynthesis